MTRELPGTLSHQVILRAVLGAYANDASILTVGVFGSIARGDGDEFSDIDIDVVIAPEMRSDTTAQLQQLIDYLNGHGFSVVTVAWDNQGHGALILLESLDRLDVTIHSPATSKAEVLESLILIRGERDALPVEGSPAITARAAQERYRYLHGEMPLLAIYVAAKLRRGKLWSALQGLQTMRNAVMEIYGLTRGSTLPSRYFIKHAPKDLQDSLGATLAIYDLAPIAESLRRLVALYREECGRLSNGHLSFSEGETKAFDRIELLLTE